jgi:hypothetical protein
MAEKYQVEQNEDLREIAVRLGFGSTERFRSLPANKALMALRADGVLKPGDKLEVPERKPVKKSVATGQKHTFTVKSPKRPVALVVRDDQGKPMANADFVLDGPNVNISGKTDGDGKLKAEVPSLECKQLCLKVGEHEIPLPVGVLDPVTTVTGVQARLSNLGYPVGARDDQFGPVTRGSIAHFQADQGLAATGFMDDQTRDKLQKVYGS